MDRRITTTLIRLALGASIAASSLAMSPVAAVEAPLPSGPLQVRSVPTTDQSWEDLRAQHRARAHWWVGYYDAHPGATALRGVLGAYEDWIDSMFDQNAIAEAKPYASRLEASRPPDVAGIHLVARFMHFDQRFHDESQYLIDELAEHPTALVLWLEVGNALGAQGLIAEPDPYAVAAALHADAVTTETALRGRLPIIRGKERGSALGDR